MGQPLSSITIVGGGTAGWLAAVYLRRACAERIRITLIESPNIPTVGVGEATVPQMPFTLRQIGLDERTFFRRCDATFKTGVMFRNWNTDRSGKLVSYLNPFSNAPSLDGVSIGNHFHAFGAGKRDYVSCYSPYAHMAKAFKGPFSFKDPKADPMPKPAYAYHLNAVAFAKLLAEVGTERGIEHILDDVDDVELDERGYVAALQLRERGRHPVELVIDCTGFRGRIIREALDEPFEDYSDYLGNDRAMALQIPHTNPEKLSPFTSSTALGAGWSWSVPLFNRVGTGYVFSSAHRTDDEARDEFLAHLGAAAPPGSEPRVIPMRIGRSRRAWVKNCIAMGLSGGFIEPLESTAIHMIDQSIRMLLFNMPSTDYEAPVRRRFNRLVDDLYGEVRDFICLHYRMGNREDSAYWIDARTELKITDRLAENLELWQYQLPTQHDLESAQLFTHDTYQTVLFGKRCYENGYGAERLNTPREVRAGSWKAYLRDADIRFAKIVDYKGDHHRLLMALRGELQPGAARKTPAVVAARTGSCLKETPVLF